MTYRKEQTLITLYPDNVKLCRTGKNRLLTLYPDNVKQWRTGKNRLLTLYPDKDKYLKQKTLNGAFWRHSKLFGTPMKTIEINLKRVGTAEKKRNRDMKLPWEETAHVLTLLRGREFFENKGGKWCRYDVLTCREKIESSKAKWCILTLFATYARPFLGGGRCPVRPLDPLVKMFTLGDNVYAAAYR